LFLIYGIKETDQQHFTFHGFSMKLLKPIAAYPHLHRMIHIVEISVRLTI